MSYREKDLDGHLAPESARRASRSRRTWSSSRATRGAPVPESSGSEARSVPEDPEKGSDAMLKVGWQVLAQAMPSPQ